MLKVVNIIQCTTLSLIVVLFPPSGYLISAPIDQPTTRTDDPHAPGQVYTRLPSIISRKTPFTRVDVPTVTTDSSAILGRFELPKSGSIQSSGLSETPEYVWQAESYGNNTGLGTTSTPQDCTWPNFAPDLGTSSSKGRKAHSTVLTNGAGLRVCRECKQTGRYKGGKCIEKWGPGPSGPGTVCDRCVASPRSSHPASSDQN